MNAEIVKKQRKLLLTIVVLFWFAQYVYVPFQTPYLVIQQVSAGTIGVIIGVYGFAQLALRMPVGIMADRNGRHKWFIFIGVAAAAIASICRLVFAPETGFLWGNMLSGLGSAMWISFMVLYATYFSGKELQRAMGLIIAGNNLGILGGFVVSTLVYNYGGMKLLCWLSVLSGIPALILCLFINDRIAPVAAIRPKVKELITVYGDKRLIFFALVMLVQQGVLMATCMSFTTQVAKQEGAAAWQIGLLSIVYILTAVLASYFAATSFARRFSAGFWIPTIMLVFAIYCYIVPIVHNPNALIASQILAGITTGIVFSCATTEAMKGIPQEKRSTAMGYYQAIYAVGMTLMPMIAGAIAEVSSIDYAFYLEGILCILVAVATWLFCRSRLVHNEV